MNIPVGANPPGYYTGPGIPPKQRTLEIKSSDFTQAEQGVPIPVIFGSVQLAGIHIVPVFGFRSKPIKTKAGK